MEKVNFKPSSTFKEKADKIFEQQKIKLQVLFPNADIEHIGGTVIPNLLTKGDLDINVRVTTKEDLEKIVETLRSLYEINQLDNWTETFASFKDDTSFELPLGIQVTVIGSPEDHFVTLREVLLRNPSMVESYNALRSQYEGKDMEEYRVAKDTFLTNNGLR